MWQAILEFLKKTASKAATTAAKLGKGVVKESLKPLTNLGDLGKSFKEGGLKKLGEEGLKQSSLGKLEEAFKSLGSKETFGQGIGQLSKFSEQQKPQQETTMAGEPSKGYARDMGILGFIGPQPSDTTGKTATTERSSIIPSNYQQFIRQPGMQYVPGPEESVIGGQGEVAQGFGMASPQSRIPPAYLQMAQGGQQPPQMQPQQPQYPGVMAGLKEGILGMPSSAYGREPLPTEQGRQTAYYAGKLIPDIIRSKLGIDTTGEEARQQQIMQTTAGKKITPEYKADLEKAVARLPQLKEQGKIELYQQLATQYPDRTLELKRIFFPQSQDNVFETLFPNGIR